MQTRYESLKDIPNRNYEGYVWFSDQKYPEMVSHQEPFDFGKVEENPFVLEALLYCESANCSLHITHSGEYHIHECHLTKLDSDTQWQLIDYIPHRLKGIHKIYFQQVWAPVPDPLCDNKPVLELQASWFVGFSEPQK